MGDLTMEYHSAVQKKKIVLFATVWMNLEDIMLNEISQAEKDKSHMISLYVESNKQTELTMKIGTEP